MRWRSRARLTPVAASIIVLLRVGFRPSQRRRRILQRISPRRPNRRPRNSQPSLPPNKLSSLDLYYQAYLRFKQELQDRYGLQYSLDLSLLPQWGAPNGGAVANFVYAPWISWTPFKDTPVGSGTFVFGLQQNQFITRQDGNALQSRAGLRAPASDWGGNALDLYQLTYSHTLPGSCRWLSVRVVT